MRTQSAPNEVLHARETVAAAPSQAGERGRPARLLDAMDVAEVLGVREKFVYALARRGELPTVRLGDRYVRFRPEALWAWIERRESTRPKGTR